MRKIGNTEAFLRYFDEIPEEIVQEENENIEDVVEAVSMTSEDVHGGNEATKDIEGSPNPADNGVEHRNLNQSHGGDSDSEEELSESESKSGSAKKQNHDKDKDKSESGGGRGRLWSQSLAMQRLPERYDSDEVVIKIREIASRERSRLKKSGGNRFNLNKVARYLVTEEDYLIPSCREKRASAKQMAFFLDVSGSFAHRVGMIRECIKSLSRAGFEITLYACGNGFNYEKSTCVMDEDRFNNREQIKQIAHGVAKLDKVITTPSIKDAARIAESSEFSVIFADFDGFSSFSHLYHQVRREKVPYLFDFEERYEKPEEHDWNDPEWCDYAPEKWLKFGEPCYSSDDDDEWYDSDEDEWYDSDSDDEEED